MGRQREQCYCSESGTNLPVCKVYLSEHLGDNKFPHPSRAIQPEDMLAMFIYQRILKLEEDLLPYPLKAPCLFL